MPPRTKSVVASRACLLSALVVLGSAGTTHASDVSDELAVGTISPSGGSSNTPYVSDRLGGSLDASEDVSLSLDGTVTRYFKTKDQHADTIFQVASAVDVTPDDHWSFGIDARGSPPSTALTQTPSGTVRSRTSLLGAGAFVEYDTAGESDAETIVEGSFGLTSYRTTQRARNGNPSPSSLTQFRVSAGLTEVLWSDTDASLFASWYAYSRDPVSTGYFGASVFGRESVSDGFPLEPLRWSVRPSVRQRFGPVRLSGYFQYGRYVSDAGWNAVFGLKAQVRVSDAWKLWISGNFQRDVEASGEAVSIPWFAAGARVTF